MLHPCLQMKRQAVTMSLWQPLDSVNMKVLCEAVDLFEMGTYQPRQSLGLCCQVKPQEVGMAGGKILLRSLKPTRQSKLHPLFWDLNRVAKKIGDGVAAGKPQHTKRKETKLPECAFFESLDFYWTPDLGFGWSIFWSVSIIANVFSFGCQNLRLRARAANAWNSWAVRDIAGRRIFGRGERISDLREFQRSDYLSIKKLLVVV